MRVPSGDAPAQPLTHLWERHKEIIRRLIAGDRQKDIADDLGMTYGRMSIICNSPAFMSQLRRMSEDADSQALSVQDRIKVLSEDAMSIMEDVLQQGDKLNVPIKTQISVAQDVLDRAGHGAVKKVHNLNESVLNADDLEDMRVKHAKIIESN